MSAAAQSMPPASTTWKAAPNAHTHERRAGIELGSTTGSLRHALLVTSSARAERLPASPMRAVSALDESSFRRPTESVRKGAPDTARAMIATPSLDRPHPDTSRSVSAGDLESSAADTHAVNQLKSRGRLKLWTCCDTQ